MLLIVCTRHAVALNFSLNRHTEYVRQIYIYEKCTVLLTSVGFAQARPNNIVTDRAARTSIKYSGNSTIRQY